MPALGKGFGISSVLLVYKPTDIDWDNHIFQWLYGITDHLPLIPYIGAWNGFPLYTTTQGKKMGEHLEQYNYNYATSLLGNNITKAYASLYDYIYAISQMQDINKGYIHTVIIIFVKYSNCTRL